MRTFLLLSFLIVTTVVATLFFNTFKNSSRQVIVQPIDPVKVDSVAVAERLSAAVKIETISGDGRPAPAASFLNFHSFLAKQFPTLHKGLKKEIVNQFSLLYTWQGSDPTAAPILLMAHQDVVPVAVNTESKWTHAPFSGAIADGFVWGRGAWDDKGNLLSILEAVELLTKENFKPKHTIYLAFGHDEETAPSGGQEGAKQIVELLRSRGVRLAFVLDEGLLIMHKSIKGVDSPIALIGVAEKGYVTLKVKAEVAPGHSSMPPQRTAIGSLSTAITKIESNQFPSVVSEVTREMFETLAPEISGINRVALSNLWLFDPFVRKQLQASPGGAAMLKTTIAPTVFQSGSKENVLPGVAEATINFRTLPGTTSQNVVAHTEKSIDDPALKVVVTGHPREASFVSKTTTASYALLQKTIREVFPDVLVAPAIMTASTDSHHFLPIADSVFRFSPIRAFQEDLARFHGTNERLSIENYVKMIQFYYRLMSNPALEAVKVQ